MNLFAILNNTILKNKYNSSGKKISRKLMTLPVFKDILPQKINNYINSTIMFFILFFIVVYKY